jgi:hypothetical protein
MARGLLDDEELRKFNAAERGEQPWYAKALPMEGRATFLPFRDTMPGSVFNQRELAVPGLIAEAANAFTAPGRSLLGTDPEFSAGKEGVNMAMNVMGGGLGTSRAMRNPTGQGGTDIGMFIGKNAKTWDESAPKLTGLDSVQRQEISDKLSSLIGTDDYETAVMQAYKRNVDAGKPIDTEVYLKDVFDHPELFKAYPELEKYKMRILEPDSKVYAKKGSDMTIFVRANATPEDARSSILHEIQHHIQETEGFARGGSANVFAKQAMPEHKYYMSAIDSINSQMKDAVGTPKYNDLIAKRDELIVEARQRGVLYPSQIEAIAQDKYKRLGGEAEARLTQARSNMSKEEMAAQNPYDPKYFMEKTGVPVDNLIFQGVGRPAPKIDKDLIRQFFGSGLLDN